MISLISTLADAPCRTPSREKVPATRRARLKGFVFLLRLGFKQRRDRGGAEEGDMR
jgi:hypothetical protein